MKEWKIDLRNGGSVSVRGEKLIVSNSNALLVLDRDGQMVAGYSPTVWESYAIVYPQTASREAARRAIANQGRA